MTTCHELGEAGILRRALEEILLGVVDARARGRAARTRLDGDRLCVHPLQRRENQRRPVRCAEARERAGETLQLLARNCGLFRVARAIDDVGRHRFAQSIPGSALHPALDDVDRDPDEERGELALPSKARQRAHELVEGVLDQIVDLLLRNPLRQKAAHTRELPARQPLQLLLLHRHVARVQSRHRAGRPRAVRCRSMHSREGIRAEISEKPRPLPSAWDVRGGARTAAHPAAVGSRARRPR
jgi:hypothetical protein